MNHVRIWLDIVSLLQSMNLPLLQINNMKNLIVRSEWSFSMIPDLKVFKLNELKVAECFPPAFIPGIWCGIYFISEDLNNSHSGQVIQINSPCIVLLNGNFSFIKEHFSNAQQGYFLLFNHNVLPYKLDEKLKELPLFFQQGCGPFTLNLKQVFELNILFEKILTELPSDYRFRKELLANLITQLVHFVLKNFTWPFLPSS